MWTKSPRHGWGNKRKSLLGAQETCVRVLRERRRQDWIHNPDFCDRRCSADNQADHFSYYEGPQHIIAWFCLTFQPLSYHKYLRKSKNWLPIEPSRRNTLKRRLKKSVRDGGKHPGCPCLVSWVATASRSQSVPQLSTLYLCEFKDQFCFLESQKYDGKYHHSKTIFKD